MFKYTAKEIASELYTFYKVDSETGAVIEIFGWGSNDNFRDALADGITTKIELLERQQKTAPISWNIFKTTERDSAIIELENLQTRIMKAIDLPEDQRSKFIRWSSVSDALLEECRRFIDVSLLDMDKTYELETRLFRWSADHTVYYVESDYTVTPWRVGMAGYKNIIKNGKVVDLDLHYLVHNFDTDRTRNQASYDVETGNMERHWSTHKNGEYIPGMEIYFANLEDAVALAEQKIEDELKMREAALQIARDQHAKMAA